MADGSAYDVPHREFIAQSPNESVVVVFKTDDGLAILDHLMITAIEVLPPKRNGRKSGNGASKKAGAKKAAAKSKGKSKSS